MTKKKFDPSKWKITRKEPAVRKEPEQAPKRPVSRPSNPDWTSSLEDQIERLTQRIEATHTDITEGYAAWRDIGFALTDALGESGRSFYHRISRFYPGYSETECDKQYDACLRAHGHGVTINTLFYLAKTNGLSIVFQSENHFSPQPSTDGIDGTDGLMVNTDGSVPTLPSKTSEPSKTSTDGSVLGGALPAVHSAVEEMPTFSQYLYGHLPNLLDEVARNATSNEDADILILGAICTWSACIPKIFGVYGGRKVFANLFLFVTAPASAGKGRLTLCRRLAQPIHDQLRTLYRDQMDKYRVEKVRYENAKKHHPELEPPEEPPLRMLIIPANSSATSVYQVLNDNGGNGLMFETEGDTLANVFSSDFGNYSDGFRKAFHHEAISYTRRKDREFVELLRPRLSAVLSGTPRQISSLIPDAENGLFSRFIFYYINFRLEWIDVFARSDGATLDEVFDDIGFGFLDLYQQLDTLPEMSFSFTESQQRAFNTYYGATQNEYHLLFGDDIVASVRRLGLITFRIAMVLSALRLADTGEIVTRLQCDDEDFASAMAISRTLIHHTVRVYRELSSAELNKPVFERTERQQQFLASLPAHFSTQSFIELASRLGIPQPSAERYIKTWCSLGLLQRIKKGYYEKVEQPSQTSVMPGSDRASQPSNPSSSC